MIITTTMNTSRPAPVRVASRSSDNMSSIAQREARLYREVAEYRGKMSEMNAKLNAALKALSDANSEIDRLNAELSAERDKVSKLTATLSEIETQKKARRQKSKKESTEDSNPK